MSKNLDVVGLNLRMKDHRVRVVKLKKPILRSEAIKFIKEMGLKGYIKPEFSFGILPNGYCV